MSRIHREDPNGNQIEEVKVNDGEHQEAYIEVGPPLCLIAQPSRTVDGHMIVIQVPSGANIVNTLAKFARMRHCDLYIINGSGVVNNAILQDGEVCYLHRGLLQLISLTGSIQLGTSVQSLTELATYLRNPAGHIVGGTVVDSLFAHGIVTVNVSTQLVLGQPLEDIPFNGGLQGFSHRDRGIPPPAVGSSAYKQLGPHEIPIPYGPVYNVQPLKMYVANGVEVNYGAFGCSMPPVIYEQEQIIKRV